MTIEDFKDFVSSNKKSLLLIYTQTVNWADKSDFNGCCLYNKREAERFIRFYNEYKGKGLSIRFGSGEQVYTIESIIEASFHFEIPNEDASTIDAYSFNNFGYSLNYYTDKDNFRCFYDDECNEQE